MIFFPTHKTFSVSPYIAGGVRLGRQAFYALFLQNNKTYRPLEVVGRVFLFTNNRSVDHA